MNAILIVLFLFSTNFLFSSSQQKCQKTHFRCNNGQCIDKKLWCVASTVGTCSDRSHLNQCGYRGTCQSSAQKQCNDSKKCIPSVWFCDGYRDCSDGSDEKNCRQYYKISSQPGISTGKQKARDWITKQRRVNWGWEDDTGRAIVSLYLSNTKQFYPGDSSSQLMVKQMQIHLSKMILRNGTSFVPAHQMALYIHALLATCLNPRNFQGFDLIKELKQKIDRSDSFNPFLMLVLCNANETLSLKHVAQLIEIMNRPKRPEWTDSQAFAAMTLVCVRNQFEKYFSPSITFNNDNYSILIDDLPYHIKIVVTDNITYDIHMDNITLPFKNLQYENGSFGSVYTTALALQALISAEDPEDCWDLKSAFQYLLSKQTQDGSFGNMLSTYLVLPLLYEKTLFDLGHISCSSVGSQTRNLTVKEELENIRSQKQKIAYSLWVGIHKDVSFSISLTIPINRTFYDAMRLANELDQRYRFEYFQYSWGKYIYSIFGTANDPEARQYWQLYHVKEDRAVFIDKTPDKVIPEKDGWYAYWYRPTNHIVSNTRLIN